MIKSIRLQNFRRHSDLELSLDDNAQLVLIAGSNGAGKSSILEGIVFALYGEGRHGRKNLDRLTKRGRELEGMSAEVVFTIGKDEYRVHRRRDGKSSTAVLYVNDTPLAESPGAVTAEVASLLGMDSAGFRLAVIAQQKDLDGLASLRPADRAQMITRLLRLDAITAAKAEAAAIFRRERDLAAALKAGQSGSTDQEEADARSQLEAAQKELARAEEAITLIEAELAATQDVEALWAASMQNVSRCKGALESAEAEILNYTAEIESLVVPDPVELPVGLAELAEMVGQVERALGEAEQANTMAEQRAVVSRELEKVQEKIRAAEPVASQIAPDTTRTKKALDAAEQASDRARETAVDRRGLKARTAALREQAEAKLSKAELLPPVCGECGQDVAEEHRQSQIESIKEEVRALQRQEEEALENERAALAAVALAAESLVGARASHEKAQEEARRVEQAKEALEDLQRRRRTYEAQLARLPESKVDIDALYAEKSRLAMLSADAREAQKAEQARVGILSKKESLRVALSNSEKRASAFRTELVEAEPGADLKARYGERQKAQEARNSEEEVASHWRTVVAVADERVGSLARRAEEAKKAAALQKEHHDSAVSAGAASRLLGDVADRLATQIRPNLEGAISGLLAAMSEGRFTSVKVTPEYDILVHDDDDYRPLSELSGGEVDLVALATRLALSQVVADRHGAGGAGFLILDECFGSQDQQRRAAILDGLRQLKDVYHQILLISHVENIEDAADSVISVRISEDREESEVELG